MPENDRKIPTPSDVLGKKDRVIPKPEDVLKKKARLDPSLTAPVDLSQGVPGGALTEELVGSTSELVPSTSGLPGSELGAFAGQAIEGQRAVPGPEGILQPEFNEKNIRQEFAEQDRLVREESIRKKQTLLPRWMGFDDVEGPGLKGFVSTKTPTKPTFDIKLEGEKPKNFFELEESDFNLNNQDQVGKSFTTAIGDKFLETKADERHINSLNTLLNESDNEKINEIGVKFRDEFFGNIDDLDRFESEAGALMKEFEKTLPEDMSNFQKEKIIHGASIRIQDRFEERKAQLDTDRRMIELQKKAGIDTGEEAGGFRTRISTPEELELIGGVLPNLTQEETIELTEHTRGKEIDREGFVTEGRLIDKLGEEEYNKNVNDLADTFYNDYEKQEKALNTKLNELYQSGADQSEIDELESTIEEFRRLRGASADPIGYLFGDVTGKADRIYDPATGDYVTPAEATPEIIDWNRRINAEALNLSNTKGVEDLKALQSRYFSEIKYLESLETGADDSDLIKRRDLFAATSRALDLNKSITNVKRNALARLGETAVEEIGIDVKTDEDYVFDYIEAQQNKGGLVTDAEKERAEQRFVDKLFSTVGGSVPVMMEIMFWTAVTEGAGTVGAIERGFARLTGLTKGVKGKKMIEGISKVAANATNREIQFQLAGETGGAGESLGGELGTRLSGPLSFLGNSRTGRVLRTFLTQSGRAAGETIEEYAGQVWTELSKDKSFSEAMGDVIGEDPLEKLALTYVTGAIFASGKVNTDFRNSKVVQEMEQAIVASESDSEIVNEAKKTIEAFEASKEEVSEKPLADKELVTEEEIVTEPEVKKDIVKVTEIEKGDTEYKVGDAFFSEKEIKENLGDPDFVEKVKSGEIDLEVNNPSEDIKEQLQETGLIEVPESEIEQKVTPEEKVVEAPIEGEQQITEPTEGPVEAEITTKIEEDGKDKKTKIEQAQEAERAGILEEEVPPVKSVKEQTIETLEKDLEGEFVSPEAKEEIQDKIDQLKLEVEEEAKIEPEKVTEPPVTEVKKVPKTITKRFIETGGLTEKEAVKIAEISQKTPKTDKARLKVVGDIEREVGLDKAFELTSNEKTGKSFSQETKNYFSIAKANDLKAKALKSDNKQERSKLIEQAANIMAKVAKTAEKKGAEIQFFNAIYEKFPEMRTKASVVNNMNQKIQVALESESDVKGFTVSEEIEGLKSKIEQEVRKQIESEVESLKSEIEQLKKVKPGKARIAKGQKQISDALAEIKRIKGENGPVSVGATIVPGVSADMINAVGQLVAGYVNVGLGSAKAIINKVFKDLKEVEVGISKEDIAKIAERDSDFAKLSEEEQIEQFASKNIELALEDFFINGMSSKETLAGHLSEKLNIPISDAKRIASNLEKKVLGKVEELAKKELEKNLAITDDLTEEEKARRRKKQRESNKIVNKVSKSVMLGALSNTDFRNAFATKYGFPEVTAEQMALLEDLVNDAKRFEKSGQRELHQKTQRRINTELKKMKPKDADFYAGLIMELAYTNALSGINTQGNANIGAISTSMVHAIGKTLEQLSRGRIGAVTYGLRGIGKSLKAASASAKEARRFNYSRFTDHNVYMEGATDQQMGELEAEVTKGMGTYLRKVGPEKSLTENTKNILKSIRSVLLQYSRMNFLLNASDAFLTTSFTEFNNAIEVYNKDTKDNGIKGIISNIVNRKQLIKELDKAMGYDNKAEIEAVVDNEIISEENKIDKEVDELSLTEKEAKREKKRRRDLTISKGYKSRRTQELMTNRRDRQIYDNAVKTARDWIMLSDPDGIFGMANESFKKFLKIEGKQTVFGKAWATFWGLNIMFSRMTAKTANAVMTSIPGLGLLPTIVGYSKRADGSWKFRYKGKVDPLLMKRRLVANALMTSTAAAAFAEMFEWDDDDEEYKLDPDRLIDVTVGGFGGTNAVKNQQTFKNYSGYGLAISFRTSPEEEFGPYRSIKYLPQALPAFAVLGNYADRTRGLGTEKKLAKFKGQEGIWKLINGPSASIAVTQMLEGSFNSIGRTTKKISMSDSENFLEGLFTAGFDMITQPTKTITQPNFYRDLINESGMRGDVKKAYPRNLSGKLKYDYYGLDGAAENKTDIFGNEYPNQDKFSQWMHGTINSTYDNPEWKLIHKFPEVTITPFRAKEDINISGRTFKISDEDVIKEYGELQKTTLKSMVTSPNVFSKLNKMSPENLQLKFNKLRSKSIEKAKREIIKKYKDTDKLKKLK